MFIDTIAGKAYIFGSDHNIGGVIILDLSNPMDPVEIGQWNDHYIHDGFVRGDTLWASCLEAGTFVIDVSNPSNPVTLTSWDTPSQFGHNVWPSDDNAYCYTTDEVESGFVTAYDMSNYQNIVETDRVRHPLSEAVIPHNAHFINDYVVTSYYRDGLTIHDVSDPTNIVMTGYFDSSPLSGGGFNGAWGAWPYLPSGNILIADIEEGLFIVNATYKRAARISGTVTEFGTGTALNDVQVQVLSTALEESTDLFGDYATGTEAAGTYDVTFQKGGYLSQTISGVQLVNGQVTVVDVELVPDVPFSVGGSVTDANSGDPIEGAEIEFVNEFFDLDFTSDASGNYLDNNFFAGEYDVVVTAWGFVTECYTIDLSSDTASFDFELEPGYYDDFTTDLGWTDLTNASAGEWERGEPVGTTFDGQDSNPDEDVDGDCGTQAYITGNGGGGAGNDDVDGGSTILRSPIMDLTTYTNPFISFDYWFFNAGGSSNPNDYFDVRISNGTNTVTLASLPQTNGNWTDFEIALEGLITVTNEMRLLLEVEDVEPGHLVEAGVDNFQVWQGTSVSESTTRSVVSIYPNPAEDALNIAVPMSVTNCELRIFDATGALIYQNNALVAGQNKISLSVQSGLYLCEFNVDGSRQVERLVVR
jgi:hypothetical protein